MKKKAQISAVRGVVELRGIEPLTSAVRLLPLLHFRVGHEGKLQDGTCFRRDDIAACDTSAIPDVGTILIAINHRYKAAWLRDRQQALSHCTA